MRMVSFPSWTVRFLFNARAFSCFDTPGFLPITRTKVLPLTLPGDFPPRFTIAICPSSRLKSSKSPDKTIDLPLSRVASWGLFFNNSIYGSASKHDTVEWEARVGRLRVASTLTSMQIDLSASLTSILTLLGQLPSTRKLKRKHQKMMPLIRRRRKRKPPRH